ncbi:MAG TPA: hypothetical protein DD670_18420 [Planctomycetaceae bacterium]|nr:hypothetical protein [Planctomycetaceae bacterium]
MVGGIAGQIALGAMSGGCSLFAAGSMLTRAAGLYTALTTATGMIAATQNFANGTAGVGDVLAFIPAASFGAAKLGLLCFVEDTQVVIDVNDDGSYVTRNIQDLEFGDHVLCRDQYDPNAPLVKQQIVETFAHETDAVRAVSVQDASGNVERLVTTDEHPFWVDRIGWVAAKNLVPGLVVTTAAGGTAVVVENFALLLDAPVTNMSTFSQVNIYFHRIDLHFMDPGDGGRRGSGPQATWSPLGRIPYSPSSRSRNSPCIRWPSRGRNEREYSGRPTTRRPRCQSYRSTPRRCLFVA